MGSEDDATNARRLAGVLFLASFAAVCFVGGLVVALMWPQAQLSSNVLVSFQPTKLTPAGHRVVLDPSTGSSAQGTRRWVLDNDSAHGAQRYIVDRRAVPKVAGNATLVTTQPVQQAAILPSQSCGPQVTAQELVEYRQLPRTPGMLCGCMNLSAEPWLRTTLAQTPVGTFKMALRHPDYVSLVIRRSGRWEFGHPNELAGLAGLSDAVSADGIAIEQGSHRSDTEPPRTAPNGDLLLWCAIPAARYCAPV